MTMSAPQEAGLGAEGSYRVLMIAPTSFFADYGCHVRILEEARTLQGLGCQVAVCTYHNGRDLPELDIRRTMSIPWRQGYEVGSSRHKIAFDLLLVLRALAAMGEFRPQVIHAHLHEGALIGAVLSRLWGVPMVFDFQGGMTSEMVDHHFLSSDGPLYAPLRRLERFIDHAAPHILTSSAHAAALLQDEFGCASGRITCVPDCVNTAVFAPAASVEEVRDLRRAWGIPPQRPVVIYLGKLAHYQGTDLLLEAAQLLCQREDAHFVIAGYPYVDYYTQRAVEMGLADRVTFTGRVRYEDAPRLLRIGDVAVAPKLSHSEGAGKLLNYMATALPTVTFDTPVSREYLGEGGVYAAPGDAADLARALGELLADPARGAALGQGLRQRAQERYSWAAAGHTILDIYRRVGARPNRR
jgi:glycosyltransferase involved in cell wall biosynthesis